MDERVFFEEDESDFDDDITIEQGEKFVKCIRKIYFKKDTEETENKNKMDNSHEVPLLPENVRST